MKDIYCTKAEMQQARNDGLIREATLDKRWLNSQLARLAPHGSDINTLYALIFEMKHLMEDAESSLSDYYGGADWGEYDVKVLQKLRNMLEGGAV